MGECLPVFMENVPDYEVRDGQMHIIISNFEIVMPLRVFMLGAAKAEKAIDKWRSEQRECAVLPFRQEFRESA